MCFLKNNVLLSSYLKWDCNIEFSKEMDVCYFQSAEIWTYKNAGFFLVCMHISSCKVVYILLLRLISKLKPWIRNTHSWNPHLWRNAWEGKKYKVREAGCLGEAHVKNTPRHFLSLKEVQACLNNWHHKYISTYLYAEAIWSNYSNDQCDVLSVFLYSSFVSWDYYAM